MKWEALRILWLRQMKRYLRSNSRILGALGQPILYLLALGYGLGSVFQKAGGGNYIEFLVPGIIVQTILFSSVFWGIQIIWDKQFGFLKETLVAPVSRLTIMMGGVLGGATIAWLQGVLVFLSAMVLGFRPANWALVPLALVVMAVLAIGMACLGSGIASLVNDFQGFQAINNFVVFPLYFLSGALYPLKDVPLLLAVVSTANPLSYAVDALRDVLIHQTHFGVGVDLVVLSVLTVALAAFGVSTFSWIEG
jgi:ABC-2 type transport system permease protein